MNENNCYITGDEARILMVALATATAAAPTGQVIQLYMRLANLSNVQPPTPKEQ